MLETYAYYSKNIDFKFVDPVLNPGEAKKYESLGYHAPKSTKEHQHQMNSQNFIVMESKGKTSLLKKISEAEITGSIIRLSRSQQRPISFLDGHGEHKIDDKGKFGYSLFKENLEKQGLKVQQFSLLKRGSIPDDTSVLVIAGPRKFMAEEEKNIIAQYLEKGGSLLALLDPLTSSGMEEILLSWGFLLKDDVVFDMKPRVFPGRKNIPVVGGNGYYKHEIKEGFNLPTFYPEVRSISFDKNQEARFFFQPLAATGDESFSKINPEDRTWADFNEGVDQKGPIVTAATVSLKQNTDFNNAKSTKPSGSRTQIVVFGDSDFVTNSYWGAVGNGDLALNAVSWLAREIEMIAIRPKETKTTQLILDSKQINTLFYTTVVAIPAFLFLAGMFVRWHRKRL